MSDFACLIYRTGVYPVCRTARKIRSKKDPKTIQRSERSKRTISSCRTFMVPGDDIVVHHAQIILVLQQIEQVYY
jgi:hypothetical protein